MAGNGNRQAWMRPRLGTLLSAALLVNACGGGASASAGSSNSGPIHLGVVVQAGGPGEAVKKLAKKYEALHPGITVEVTDLPYDATREASVADFTSHKAAYDVVAFDYLWMKEYALGKFILPLDDLIAKNADAVKMSDFFQPYIDYGKYSDKLYGLPWLGAVYMLYYRKDLLAKAGIRVPTTWVEYAAAAKALRGKGADYGTTVVGKRDDPLVDEFWSIAWSYGANIYDGKHATIDSPESLAALKVWQDVISTSAPDSLAMSWPEVAILFAQGKAAMMLNFSDSSETVLAADSKVADKVGFALVPTGPTGKATPNLGGWGMGVNADSAHPKEAFDFIAWLNSAESQKDGLQYGGSSTRVSVLEDPTLRDKYPWMPAAAENFKVSVPFPKATNWTDWEAAMAPPISEALAGQKSPEQALKDAQQRLEVEVTKEFK